MDFSSSVSRCRIHARFFSVLMVLCVQYAILFPVQASSSAGFQARVVKVLDGDSLVVDDGNSIREIRLWGVDTPEWGQPFSRQAKKFLKKNLLDKSVYLEPLYLDTYQRTIARVFVSGTDVGQLLVERGYAWVHIYYCNKKICSAWKKIEQKARKSRIGLWSQDKPVAPWQWKKMKGSPRR